MKRVQLDPICNTLRTSKIVLLEGARKVGKSELLNEAFMALEISPLELDCADKVIQKSIDEASLNELKELFNGQQFVLLKEAQYLEHLQEILEWILSDEIKCTLVLTCSFETKIDPLLMDVLVAEKMVFRIYPYTFYELANYNGLPQEEKLLDSRLIYGQFPSVVDNLETADHTLKELLDLVIFTRLGVLDRINKRDALVKMLQFISFKIGEPTSYNEIAEYAGLDNETVERYINLLMKSYVLLRLPVLSSEKRYELKKSHSFYFYDLGIRNALINNFNPLSLRMDVDQLWKNWTIIERLKWNSINNKKAEYFFWRSHTKQVVDFIELTENTFTGYKMSWSKKKRLKIPKMFESYYPNCKVTTLNKSTYWGFLTKK